MALLAWLAAGVLTLWLLGSGLSPDVAAWAPLQDKLFGGAVLEAEGLAPLLLLAIAGLGHLLMPRLAEKPKGFGPLALVPFLFCLGYFCSIYRPEALWGIDHDPYSNFLGYLPYSDASDYYDGARRLLDVGELTAFTERRPANAAWLAIRLSVSGSLSEATLLQVILAGMAASYLGFVVLRLFGPWSSVAVVALTYAYSRFFFTTTLSETPGITCSTLGVGLILLGIRTENRGFIAAGMSALGLAESFRSGALIAPLGFAAGAALLARPGLRMRAGLLAAGPYLLTGLLSTGLNTVYGSGKGQAGANLSYVVAGLSLGGNWGLARRTYAAELAVRPSEREQARFLYAAAAENVRQDPWRAFRAFGDSVRRLGSRTNLDRMNGVVSIVIALLLLHRILRRLAIPAWPLRVAGPFGFGLLLCLPVILPYDGLRIIAASTPAVFTFLAVLLASPTPASVTSTRHDRIAALCPVLMIIALLVVPGIARRVTGSPETSCLAAGRSVIRHPSREPAVLYESNAASSRRGVPVVTPERVQAQQPYSNNPLVIGDPPVLLDWAYDYSTHHVLSLVAPPELVDTRASFLWIETVPLGLPENHRLVERFGPWDGCGPPKQPAKPGA